MEVNEFINGKVTYDKNGGQYFWINDPFDGLQMLAELRGWGAVQHLFKDKKGNFDLDGAEKFHDKVGEFIAAAINEKLEREHLDTPIGPK